MTNRNLSICPGPAPGPPTPGSLPRWPLPSQSSVPQSVIHSPLHLNRGYTLCLGLPPLGGLWGLQASRLVLMTLSLGLLTQVQGLVRAGAFCPDGSGAGSPAAPGSEGQGHSFLLTKLLTKQPLAPTMCKVLRSTAILVPGRSPRPAGPSEGGGAGAGGFGHYIISFSGKTELPRAAAHPIS